MDKDETLLKIAAIITTLEETGGSPESMLYIFCDMSMDKWNVMRRILVESNLVSISGYYVTLTPNGKAVASRLNKAISK